MNSALLQLVIVILSTVLFTVVGIWWLRSASAPVSDQLVTEASVREFPILSTDGELTVGTLAVRNLNGTMYLSLRVALPRPVEGAEYRAIGVDGDVRDDLGPLVLGNGQQFYLTVQRSDPLPYSEMVIEVVSTTDASQRLPVARISL